MKIGHCKHDPEEYNIARDALRLEEISLRDHVERVAAMRRALPQSGEVEDYEFKSCPEGEGVKLSTLFRNRDKPLIVQQYMYGGAQTNPCPMCTLWLDGVQGIKDHLKEMANFAVIAEAEPDILDKWFRSRGWGDIDYYSSAGTGFKSDFSFEDADKSQFSGYSVFTRNETGTIHHHYSVSAILDDGKNRGMDLMSPLWNLLDLTPDGRGEFMPSLRND